MASRVSAVIALVVAPALTGCYEARERDGDGMVEPRDDAEVLLDGRVPEDAGAPDADLPLDAGPPFDAHVPIDVDAGPIDAGPIDAGLFDAGPRDAGPRDAGPIDAGLRDAGPRDSGQPVDAGPRDAGPPLDAGPRDAGPRDAGAPDAGRRSVALRFAPDQYLLIPDRPGLRVGADTTTELWMRARGTGLVMRKGQDGGQRHLVLELATAADGSVEVVVGWTTVRNERRELRAPYDGLDRWTHVAFTLQRTGGVLRGLLYVDFTVVASADLPDDIGDAFNTEALLVGRFDGDLDEIRIWNTVRSATALRNAAFTRQPTGTTGLAAYWPLEEAPAGQIALDRALRGNDAILGQLTTADPRDPTWIYDGPI